MNRNESHIPAEKVSQLDPFGRLTKPTKQSGEELLRKTADLYVDLESKKMVAGLVTKENRSWRRFLGEKIEVPAPPEELLDTLDVLEEKSIPLFEPHYIPKMSLGRDIDYPGWKKKPEDWYWECIEKDVISPDAPNIGGHWMIIDSRKKPVFDAYGHNYEEDTFVGGILSNLRLNTDKVSKHLPVDSRFLTYWQETNGHILPAIADALEVNNSMVRLPKFSEFNVLGNLFYPQWEKTDSREWLDDEFHDKSHLVTEGKTLEYVSFSFANRKDLAFRPMIVFPEEK